MNWKTKDFTELYNDYYPVVVTSLECRSGSIHDARDMAQEIFISLLNNIDKVENVRKWLYGAIRNSLKNFYNKRKNDANIDDEINSASMTYVNGFKDTRILLEQLIEDEENYKSDTEQVIFDLVAIKQFSFVEAGKQLGMSARRVRYAYNQTVKRMLYNLEKKGITNLEDIL